MEWKIAQGSKGDLELGFKSLNTALTVENKDQTTWPDAFNNFIFHHTNYSFMYITLWVGSYLPQGIKNYLLTKFHREYTQALLTLLLLSTSFINLEKMYFNFIVLIGISTTHRILRKLELNNITGVSTLGTIYHYLIPKKNMNESYEKEIRNEQKFEFKIEEESQTQKPKTIEETSNLDMEDNDERHIEESSFEELIESKFPENIDIYPPINPIFRNSETLTPFSKQASQNILDLKANTTLESTNNRFGAIEYGTARVVGLFIGYKAVNYIIKNNYQKRRVFRIFATLFYGVQKIWNLRKINLDQKMIEELAPLPKKVADLDQEHQVILKNMPLRNYYTVLVILLRGTWKALETILTDFVVNSKTTKSGILGQSLSLIGEQIPGLGIIAKAIEKALQNAGAISESRAITRFTRLFAEEKEPEKLIQKSYVSSQYCMNKN